MRNLIQMTRAGFIGLAGYTRLFAMLAIVGGTMACGGDTTEPVVRKDLMWDLTVFPRAISIPVNQTLPLIVKPLDHDGNVIDHDVTVKYVSSDTTLVAVDSDGVLRAKNNTFGQGVLITVTVQAGLVSKTEYIYAGVTDGPVDVDSISLKPAFGEPILTVGSFGIIQARVFDPQGNEIPGVFSLIETDKNAFGFLMLGGGFVIVQGMGDRVVHASVFVNGKQFSDSIVYRTRYRDNVEVSVSKDATGGIDTRLGYVFTENIFISPNGQAAFVNNWTVPIDVTFERPNDVKGDAGGAPGGDIIQLAPYERVSRWFPGVGDYFFTVKVGTKSKRISLTVKGIE